MVAYDEFLFRLLVAAVAGLIVGIDREIKHKPLGARAYILTSAASAAWIMITLDLAVIMDEAGEDIAVDPTRLVQWLVGALGFLGAGAIISTTSQGRLRGVASGAAIWAVGAIGLAAGAGMHAQALTLAVLVALVLNAYNVIVGDEDADG